MSEQGRISQKEGKRGRPLGNGRSLTPAQEASIQKDIVEQLPDQLKLSFALWTAQAVKQLIKQSFSLDMPARTVRLLFESLGGLHHNDLLNVLMNNSPSR